ncbi:GYF domain-containing protein [Xanthomonas sp. GPE 39]|uniref:GYF domain-containing protein n=1 Tax=Xanthomonas sp. GPE 39 TaxID=1583099 RepID=UPI0005F2FD84|nr:GYF domain-containing protein [Xanthomonas sp. GPE 39]
MHTKDANILWHYIDAARERHGPLSAQTLRTRLDEGLLTRDNLVWREGMTSWQPLHTVALELELRLPATPPPLPPLDARASSPTTKAPARHRGLPGCAIAAIVAVGASVALIPVLAILAAIAIPLYQSYLARSQVILALGSLTPLQTEIAKFATQHPRCATNSDIDFGMSQHDTMPLIGQIRIGRLDNGHCGLEATLRTPNRTRLDGKALWLDYDARSSTWHCSSSLNQHDLPAQCQGTSLNHRDLPTQCHGQ